MRTRVNMESLITEEALEQQIQQCKSQLCVVNQRLESAGLSASDKSSLGQLKEDLLQLVQLTEESLLEVKKQSLLRSLQLEPPHTSASEQHAATAHEPPTQQGSEGRGRGRQEGGAPGPEEEEEEEEEEEVEDVLNGMKCQAPIQESWGAVNYHNAMVVCREGEDEPEGDDDVIRVRVLFTHPTYNAMKPCPYFMDGRCRFDQDGCRFSHGRVVELSQLQPFQEPDFSLAHIGGSCLARHSSDGLWHKAVISSIENLYDSFTVHFTALNSTEQLQPDAVLPIASSDESTSSSEEGEGEGEECVRVLEWKPQRALGDWEKHTTGIGSRLLAKMGYEIGKGLGKEGQGRVEPVKIVILPAGKSLDVCAELREAKKLGRSVGGEGAKRRRKRAKKEQKLSESLSVEKEEHQDMFEFLNSKILNRPADPTTLKGSAQNPKIGRKENPNVMLLKVQEDMKSTRKRCLSLQEALKRNKGDKTMETKLREKLEAAKTNLEELQHQEHSIDKSITSKKERKKLCIF